MKTKILTAILIALMMGVFTVPALAVKEAKISNLRAACNGDSLVWGFACKDCPRNPVRVELWVIYQESSSKDYAKLTGQHWWTSVSSQEVWYGGSIAGGCLVPAWAWNRGVKFKIAAKPVNGDKITSKNWLEPTGMFYPDNQAKFIGPPGWFEKYGWWKFAKWYCQYNENPWSDYCWPNYIP